MSLRSACFVIFLAASFGGGAAWAAPQGDSCAAVPPAPAHVEACSIAALEGDDPAAALAMLDAGSELRAGSDAHVARDMLRALALAEAGRESEAVALAQSAAAQRPYALGIQRAATILRSEFRTAIEPPLDLWTSLVRIDPASRDLVVKAEMRAGNWAGVVALDDGEGPRFTAPPSLAQLLGHASGPSLSEWTGRHIGTLQQAYAHAALGHTEYARTLVAATQQSMTEQRAAAANHPVTLALVAMLEREAVSPLATQVEARIALEAGDMETARTLAARISLAGPTGEDLARRLARAAGAGMQPAFAGPDESAPTPPAPRFASLARAVTFAPGPENDDEPASLATMPLGDGVIEIAYRGTATSPSYVQDRTLLAAARTAEAAGRTHFVIVARRDHAMPPPPDKGSGEGPGPGPYRTVLRIAYPEFPDEEPAALVTGEVIAALASRAEAR